MEAGSQRKPLQFHPGWFWSLGGGLGAIRGAQLVYREVSNPESTVTFPDFQVLKPSGNAHVMVSLRVIHTGKKIVKKRGTMIMFFVYDLY